MEFYRERKIKNSIKKHKCMFCREKIQGEHLYITGKDRGDFFNFRTHLECKKLQQRMCSECDSCNDCYGNLQDCFYEKIRKGK